jgi:hypothetical protein
LSPKKYQSNPDLIWSHIRVSLINKYATTGKRRRDSHQRELGGGGDKLPQGKRRRYE